MIDISSRYCDCQDIKLSQPFKKVKSAKQKF
jgi:hypothetical protein